MYPFHVGSFGGSRRPELQRRALAGACGSVEWCYVWGTGVLGLVAVDLAPAVAGCMRRHLPCAGWLCVSGLGEMLQGKHIVPPSKRWIRRRQSETCEQFSLFSVEYYAGHDAHSQTCVRLST